MLAFKNLKIDTALLARVDDLKKQVDALKPLPKDVEGKIWQKYRLDWNYHSNAIEGNSLTFGETQVFLREGLTAKGKPLKDHLDMKGHNEVIEYLLDLIKNKDYELSEHAIRGLHSMLLVEPYESKAQTPDGQPTTKTILLGEYKKQPNHVETPTGEIHYYATPEETPARMTDLIDWYRREKETLPPVILAALLHYEFVNIHPFDDGNGRMSRILMNLVLLQNGFPPVVIKKAERNEYYAALAQADVNIYEPFIELIATNLIHSLEIYIKGAKGEDIAEPDDIDKEIELFFIKNINKVKENRKERHNIISNILRTSFLDIANKIFDKSTKIRELFNQNDQQIQLKENTYITSIPFSSLKSATTFNSRFNESNTSIEAFEVGYIFSLKQYKYRKKEDINNTRKDLFIKLLIHFDSDSYFISIPSINYVITYSMDETPSVDQTNEIVKLAIKKLLTDIENILL